jgi:hypothetical protein
MSKAADLAKFIGNNEQNMKLLLNATISSAVAQYDIDSTYINSTYDTYVLNYNLLPSTDNKQLQARVFVGGTVQTGDIYQYENAHLAASSYGSSSGGAFFRLSFIENGNAAGEGIIGSVTFRNVNSTSVPFSWTQLSNHNSSVHYAAAHGGALLAANRADVVNGWRFYYESGNIASGSVKLYGIN